MSQDSTGTPSWEAVAAELRAYREQQKQTWGDLDSALIGRYLADEVTDTERSLVETSLQDHPELRILTEIVGDVLADCTPAAPVETEAVPPRILSFTSAKPARKNRFQRYQRQFALAAAACLLFGLGVLFDRQSTDPSRAGTSVADGSLEANRKGQFRIARKEFKPVGQEVGDPLSRPEQDVVALANDFVDKNEFEKAAQVLFFVPPRQPTPDIPAPPAPHTRQLNQAVVNLAERVLETMSASDDQDKKKDSGGFNPAGTAGGSGIKFVSAPDAKSSETRGWILSNSLPYLVDGVKQQTDRGLQRRSATALGRMGSYAAPVVSQLGETLRNSDCPVQQTVLTEVFRNLGPEARPAAKDIEYVAGKCCKEVQPHAREALAAVRMPDWIGVRDNAHVLDEKVKQRVNQRIRELSRVHHIHVVAETVSKLPPNAMAAYSASKGEEQKAAYLVGVARKRSHDIGAERGVYLLICVDPPSVQLALGTEAAAGKPTAGLAVDAARGRLEKSLKANGYDKGLEEVVQTIEQALAK